MSANITVATLDRILIAVTAGGAAVISTFTDAGMAGDVQSLAVMGSVSCARSSLRDCLEDAQWCLTPISYGPSEAPGLYGTFTLGIGFLFLHILVYCYFRFHVSRQNPTLSEKDKWLEAGEMAHYPSFSFAVLSFFFQGIALRTCENYSKGKEAGQGLTLSFAGGGFAIMLVTCLFVWMWKYFRGEFVVYKDAYKETHPVAVWLLLPQGFWRPRGYVARFGYMFWGIRPSMRLFIVAPWIRMVLFAVIASVENAPGNSCSNQFALLGSVAFAYAALLVILRPYRTMLSNIASTLSNLGVSFAAYSGYMEWNALPVLVESLTASWFMLSIGFTIILYREHTEWLPLESNAQPEGAEPLNSRAETSTPTGEREMAKRPHRSLLMDFAQEGWGLLRAVGSTGSMGTLLLRAGGMLRRAAQCGVFSGHQNEQRPAYGPSFWAL